MKSAKTYQKKLKPLQLQILVCCHKECDLPRSEYLFPIHVGAAGSSAELSMQRDDMFKGEPCDNISGKNSSYCELTAMYWAWKNMKSMYPDLEYIGLNHYRRYFALGERVLFDDKRIASPDDVAHYGLDAEYVSQVLSNHDAIVAKKKIYPYPLTIDYSSWNLCKDLRTLYEVLCEMHPESKDAFIKTMCQKNTLAMYNMFVMTWREYEKYCEWLFGMLFEVEARTDTTSYESNYARIYGYMAERLLNVWFLQRKLRVDYEPVVFYSDEATTSAPHLLVRNIRSEVSFTFLKPLNSNNADAFFRYPNG